MAQCKYIYRSDDKDVIEGKYREGDRCKSNYAPPDKDHPYKGHCAGHAKTLARRGELTLPEKLKEDRKGKGRAIVEAGSKIAVKKDANSFLTELARLTENGFDAIEAYEKVKKINPYPTERSGAEKYLFAMWLLAAQDSRRPQTQSEFSTLTGVSMTQLELWRVGDELLDFFDDHRKSFMQRKGHMVDLALLAQINTGNLKAMELYYEMFPVSKREIKGRGQGVAKRTLKITEEVFSEANDAMEEHKKAYPNTKIMRINNDVVKQMEEKAIVDVMKSGDDEY